MGNHQRLAYTAIEQLAQEIRLLLPEFFGRDLQTFRLQLGLDYIPPIKLEPTFQMKLALACKVQRLPVSHIRPKVIWAESEIPSENLLTSARAMTLPHKAHELVVNLLQELGDAATYKIVTIGSAEGIAQTVGKGGQRVYVVP